MSHVIGHGRRARETYPNPPPLAGSNPQGLLLPPVDVAGGSVNNLVRGGPNNFVGADAPAGNIVYNLFPNPVGGDVVAFKLGQTGAIPSLINASGVDIEDIGNPGHYQGVGGQTQLVGQGASVVFQFDANTSATFPSGRWIVRSTA